MYFYVEYDYNEEQHMEKEGDIYEWDEIMTEKVGIHESRLHIVMNQFFKREGWNFYIHPM